jgi:hypothetical protein
VAGAALRLGRAADVTTWHAVADDLHALPFPVPRFAWLCQQRLSASKFHAALHIPIGTNDTVYLIPDQGGALHLGGDPAVVGANFRATNVWSIDGNFSAGVTERGRAFRAGAWTTFTPTFTNLTLGNGTATGRYTQVGQTTVLEVIVVFGTTTTITGAVTIGSLPTNNNASATSLKLGDVTMFDSSSGFVYMGVALTAGATTANLFNNAIPIANVTAAVPFAWATGDQLAINMVYENT